MFGSFHFSLVENSCAETVAVPARRVSLSFGFILLVVTKYARWCDSTGSKRTKITSKHGQTANMNRFLVLKLNDFMENPKQGLEKRPQGFQFVIGATQSKRPAHRVDPVESKSKQNSRAIGVCAQGVVHAPKSCPYGPLKRHGRWWLSISLQSLHVFIRRSCI